MVNLLKKLLRIEDTTVTYNQGMDFLRANGINVEDIHFPNSDELTPSGTSEYSAWFSNLKAKLVSINNKPSTIITGLYHAQARANHRAHGLWQPGDQLDYPFSIQDNVVCMPFRGELVDTRRV